MFCLLLKKPLCYSALPSLSFHQSQLMVFITYHSCHQFIFLVSYPFGALGGFSIQLSSHFSPCPGSSSSSQHWWQTLPATGLWGRCQPGCSCAHTLQCLSTSLCSTGLVRTLRAGGECWCETIQPFCQLPRAQGKPPWPGKTNTTNPKLTMQMFCTMPSMIHLLLNTTYSKHFKQLNQNNYGG